MRSICGELIFCVYVANLVFYVVCHSVVRSLFCCVRWFRDVKVTYCHVALGRVASSVLLMSGGKLTRLCEDSIDEQ